jgi:uncharacterized protein YggU (UPF0235/DUF167 family)
MRIFVKLKPSAKEEKIEKIGKNHFLVSVKEPAKQGRANARLIKKLAEYFCLPSSLILLRSGFSSREKVVEIRLDDKK